MIRRPPRSTPKPSSAASDVYKRQVISKNFSVKISEDYISIFLNEAAIVDNSLSLLIEINKKKIKVESSFNLNQKLCSFKVNEEIFYFKINDLINIHTSDVSFLDCRTTTVLVQSTQKDLLKLMPKDTTEDLSKKLISPMPGSVSYTHLTLPTKA